jgi:hypothetical protein
LFDCAFDEETEDYPDDYQVYAMPDLDELDLSGSWVQLPQKALRSLGAVPVAEVAFDSTRRKALEPALLDRLLQDSVHRAVGAAVVQGNASSKG